MISEDGYSEKLENEHVHSVHPVWQLSFHNLRMVVVNDDPILKLQPRHEMAIPSLIPCDVLHCCDNANRLACNSKTSLHV